MYFQHLLFGRYSCVFPEIFKCFLLNFKVGSETTDSETTDTLEETSESI